MKSARQIAVESLCHWEKEDAWSSIVLSGNLNAQAKLSSTDKGFAAALFYGTITYKYAIDTFIKPLSKRPLAKIDPVVLNIIRTGIYQMLYMDSVPDHSAVDEAVKLTRIMKKTSASGFVNAVLRGFLRTDKKIPDDLPTKYSCPPELVDSFIKDYGEDNAIKILEASVKSPPSFIRINPNKTSVEHMLKVFSDQNIASSAVEVVPNCIKLQSSAEIYELPEYANGFFHVQDLSSQISALALGARKGERLLDSCAAPGGKSFVLAQEVGDDGEVASCDIYPARVAEIEARNKRLGLGAIKTHALDMTKHHPELGVFDRVLCDAPCSGYGVIRRRPEIKYTTLLSQKTLPTLQLRLLEAASKHCKNGGILVYSTCTLRKEENENVVAKFLKDNPHFALSEDEKTIFIGENGADGFFIATMVHNY